MGVRRWKADGRLFDLDVGEALVVLEFGDPDHTRRDEIDRVVHLVLAQLDGRTGDLAELQPDVVQAVQRQQTPAKAVAVVAQAVVFLERRA